MISSKESGRRLNLVNDKFIVSDIGNGQTLLILSEGAGYAAYVNELAQSWSERGRCLAFQAPPISLANWGNLDRGLAQLLGERGVRQATCVSFGHAGALLQQLLLSQLKLVRRAVFVDALTSPHPSRWYRFLDWLESRLPMGLPFRMKGALFNSTPFLQRMRCPVLVVTTPAADAYTRSQAVRMNAGLPTSWAVDLPAKDAPQALVATFLEFQEVAAKCPQKAA